jgi:hypothetical protein
MKRNERDSEIPENKDWHAMVYATNKQSKPLWWVETVMGTTVDVCLSESLAWAYIARSRAPKNQFKVYKRDALGHMYLCQR